MIRHAVQVVKTTTVTYVIETPSRRYRTSEVEKRLIEDLVERVQLAEAMGSWPEGCVQRVMLKAPDRVEYLLGHPELRFELNRGDEKGR